MIKKKAKKLAKTKFVVGHNVRFKFQFLPPHVEEMRVLDNFVGTVVAIKRANATPTRDTLYQVWFASVLPRLPEKEVSLYSGRHGLWWCAESCLELVAQKHYDITIRRKDNKSTRELTRT